MKRQLYYLLPDAEHTQQVCEDLQALGIEQEHLHAVMHEKSAIKNIRDVHSSHDKDRDFFVEWFLWRLNLSVFVLALLVFIGLAILMPSYYMLIPVMIMLMTFLIGLYFSLRVPDVHWNEFSSAIQHGEVLLIVDTPVTEMQYIDHQIHQRHPEAINGGVCWKV